MESEGKSARGLFVRRRVAVCGVIFVVAAIVVVALLAHYLTSCPCERGAPTVSVDEESSAPPAPPTTPTTSLNLRLPTSLRPLHYELRLQPFLTNFTFIGRVVIRVLCEKSTDVITLHSLNLTLVNESIELAGNESSTPRVVSYDYQRDQQFLIFRLDGALVVGRSYNLTLEFSGILLDNLVGMYRSKYDDGKWMVTTQFQATDARRAFPCFDEPAMKATFSVTLVRPKELMSISNMPQIKNETLGDDWVMDIYQITRIMSTYLLAFVITDFSMTHSKSQGGIDFRVFSRHGAIDQTNFAAETGPRVLDFYEKFFNVKYPLPKQDMIAIPDFGAGAMENWGLITYRETTLLFDQNISATINKERVAIVIAHELAHQWFGNLVTPLWWDDLWLNEGFATYMENCAVDDLFKEWKMMEKFLTRLHSVLEDDSLLSSHPVSVPVNNPEQINEIFDSISYEKGSSIIRMMVHFLGNDVFRQGLQTYFKEKEFSNAAQNDLWRHMTQAANANGNDIDVKKIMDTWTVQTGYPVVKVRRNLMEQTVTLEQRRFLLIPDKTLRANEQYKWEIPINFVTESNRDFNKTLPMKWMHNLSTETKITFNKQDGVPPDNEWIIFNVQQTGYYRINYEDDNWSKIIRQLNDDHTLIHVSNRAQLIDDAFNLARAGQLNYSVALDLLKYLAKEEEYIPWKTAASALSFIDAMCSRSPAYGKWKWYVGEQLVKPQYDSVKLDNIAGTVADSEHINRLRRTLLVVKACHFGLEDCIKTAISIFNDWMGNGTKISPDVRDLVLCKAVENGGFKEWDFVWEKLNSSNVGSEKESYLHALCCTREPWLISRLLNMILHPDGKNVRHQDSRSVASALARNKLGRYLLMDFVKDKLKELRKVYSGAFIFPRLVRVAMLNLNTPFELEQLKQFQQSHASLLGGAERTMTQVIEETESNVKWMSRNYETIDQWLESQPSVIKA